MAATVGHLAQAPKYVLNLAAVPIEAVTGVVNPVRTFSIWMATLSSTRIPVLRMMMRKMSRLQDSVNNVRSH